MAKKQKVWMYSPPKLPKPKIPDSLKADKRFLTWLFERYQQRAS